MSNWKRGIGTPSHADSMIPGNITSPKGLKHYHASGVRFKSPAWRRKHKTRMDGDMIHCSCGISYPVLTPHP